MDATAKLLVEIATDFMGPQYQEYEDMVLGYDYLEHYTSPQAAVEIIKNREIWLSNVRYMNDVNELIGGIDIIHDTYSSIKTSLFRDNPSISEWVDSWFRQFCEAGLSGTYAFCLTGHDAKNPNGRLPMWRSYGADGDGVCLVLKRDPIINNRLTYFPVHWTPMICERPEQLSERVKSYLTRVEEVIVRRASEINSLNTSDIVRMIAGCLFQMAAAHKHNGFTHEREIRLIHTESTSDLVDGKMCYDGVIVRGIARPVFKMKLVDYAEHGLPGTDLANILDHVIIGPSHNGSMQAQAFRHLLNSRGLGHIPVHECDIPYRRLRD